MSEIIAPEFQQFIDDQIGSGRYQSAAEVISDGLRLLQERERRLQALRAEIQTALDRLDRGEGIRVDAEGVQALFEELVDEVDGELATISGRSSR